MLSIVTLTLNPALDKSTEVASLIPEKKLRCSRLLVEPGGGGINVARAITHLGGKALAVFLAGGENGNILKSLLIKGRVQGLPIETIGGTRENITVSDRSTNLQYRFVMPGAEVTPTEWATCLKAITQLQGPDFLVVSGSLCPGMPASVMAELAQLARKKGSKFIVDTAGEALQAAVNEGVFLIKPNLDELASLSGNKELHLEDIVHAAKKIITEKKCEVVITSMGAGGAVLITTDFTFHIPAPPVIRKSTVGAGDSMVAGIVYSLANGESLKAAAQYGVACGTAATMNPGTGLCKRKDVNNLITTIKGLADASPQ